MLWRLASAWGDSPPRNSCTTWRLNSIECVRCLAMGFLLESPVQLADSQGPYLSTSKGALQTALLFNHDCRNHGRLYQDRSSGSGCGPGKRARGKAQQELRDAAAEVEPVAVAGRPRLLRIDCGE